MSALVKSRMAYPSGSGIQGWPGKKAIKWVLLCWHVVDVTEFSAAMKASAAALITFMFIMLCVIAEFKTCYRRKMRVREAQKESDEAKKGSDETKKLQPGPNQKA